jgi:hypothetical protein
VIVGGPNISNMHCHRMEKASGLRMLEAFAQRHGLVNNDPSRIAPGRIKFLMDGRLAARPWVGELSSMGLEEPEIIAYVFAHSQQNQTEASCKTNIPTDEGFPPPLAGKETDL